MTHRQRERRRRALAKRSRLRRQLAWYGPLKPGVIYTCYEVYKFWQKLAKRNLRRAAKR